jgi:hypothetical protein
MAQTIATLVAGTPTFALKDDLVAALASEGIIDPTEDLYLYGAGKLLSLPPDQDTMNGLLEACNVHKGTIAKGDSAAETALVKLIRQLAKKVAPPVSVTAGGGAAPAATGAAVADKEKKAADEFALRRYGLLHTALMSRVRAADQFEGKMVKKTSDGVDAGSLPADCYKLVGIKGALAAEAEKKTCLAEGVVITTMVDVENDATRNGEVLLLIWRHGRMLLAAAFRPVDAAAMRNPKVASLGEYGDITVDDTAPGAGAGATKKERWHLTPDSVDQLFLMCLAATTKIGPKDMLAAYTAFWQLVVRMRAKRVGRAVG